jgi:predicted Zn-dependent protease
MRAYPPSRRPGAHSSVLAVAIACVAVALGGCSTNPVTGRSQLIAMSPDQVAAMGDEAAPQLTEQYGGEVASPELRGYVDGIGQVLAAQTADVPYAPSTWSFIVLDDDIINAFALPGGHVFISRGLLEQMNNEAQVAGVLGHEIGHVVGRRVDERLSSEMLRQIGMGVIGVVTDQQLIVAGADLLSGGVLLKFNRDQELESDRLGVRFMSLAGYDPVGQLQVMEILAAAGGSEANPELFSTHPHPETRVEALQELINGEYADTQSNPSYQLHQQRFQQQAAPHLTPGSASLGGQPMAFGRLADAGWCGLCRAGPAPDCGSLPGSAGNLEIPAPGPVQSAP